MAKKKKGFSVIEIVLAAAIFSVFSLSIVLAVLQGSNTQKSSIRTDQARIWAAEGIEAARAIRAQAFENLTDTAGSGIRFSDGQWELAGSHDEWEGYRRTISIQKARRDGNGNLVDDGGTEDDNSKLVKSVVEKGDYSLEFSAYLSNREIIPIIP